MSVQKKSGKYYPVLYLFDPKLGKKKYKWFKGYATKKEATKAEAFHIIEFSKRNDVLDSNIIFEDAAKLFIKDKAHKRGATLSHYDLCIRRLNLHIGKMQIKKIQTKDYEEVRDNLRIAGIGSKGLSERSIKHTFVVLNMILNYMIEKNLIIENRASKIKISPSKSINKRIYTYEELKKLYQITKFTTFEIPVRFAIETGLRLGEILALSWADIDFKNNTITTSQTISMFSKFDDNGKIKRWYKLTPEMKTDSSRRSFHVRPVFIDYLEVHYNDFLERKKTFGKEYNPHQLIILTKNDSFYRPDNFSSMYSRFIKNSDIRNLRFHDLRHTHATTLLNNPNITLSDVSSRIGHSLQSTTLDIYSHTVHDSSEKIIKALNNSIDSEFL